MGALNNFYIRFANDKKLRRLIIIIALTGILLLALSEFIDFSKKSSAPAANFSAESYIQDLEHRITKLISSVEGVGQVKVMISLKNAESSGEVIKNADGNIKDSYNNIPQVGGVLIICEGGDNYKVAARLTQAVSVALNVEYNKIFVTKMQISDNTAA